MIVRARRRALARQGRGRLLDLGGADSHRNLWTGVTGVADATVLDGVGVAHLARMAAAGERFDTIFSVFQLASSPDLGETLRSVREVLAEDGRVLFLEPGSQVGLPGRLQRLVAPPLGGLTGWRADRDVPAELRAAALSVIDLRRHRVPTLQLWLRQVLEGVAHHALPPGGPSGDATPPDPA
jgi:SAM-dependent methyltransferase